jgi:hypothetical protein
MAQQPSQWDIDELMAALGGNYARDDVMKVARDLDMLPQEKPQVVLGDMVMHPLPPQKAPQRAPVSRDVFPDISKPSCVSSGQRSTPDEDVPFLEDAVAVAPGAQENTIHYANMLHPEMPAQKSRWQKLKGIAGSAAKYVGKAIANGTVAGAQNAREVYQRQTPRGKEIMLGTAAVALAGIAAYFFWPKAEPIVIDEKAPSVTLSYNGKDWKIPQDRAKDVAAFMDGSFVKGVSPQTIESKLIAADLADTVKDNRIHAVGMKYLK